MRMFKYDKDPILLDTTRPDQWYRLDNIGFSVQSTRIITYASIALILSTIFLSFWLEYDPVAQFGQILNLFGVKQTLSAIFLGILILIVSHEAIHILFYPDHGLSEKTIVGAHPVMVFSIYCGEISKIRMISCLLAPLIILGVILLWVLFYWTQLRPITFMFLVAHCLMCVGDIFLIIQIINIQRKFTHLINNGSCLWVK